jgi:hypothetical protein
MIALLVAAGTSGRRVAAALAEQGADARTLLRDAAGADVGLPAVAADLRDRMASFAAGAPTTAVARLTGRPPRPLQDFLAENARSFRRPTISRLLSP